jgi:predicted Zn-dependent protease
MAPCCVIHSATSISRPATLNKQRSTCVQRWHSDPAYSAAWKLLGKALSEAGQPGEALAAYEQGIVVAEARGDLQAAREMTVFARRLRRQLPAAER